MAGFTCRPARAMEEQCWHVHQQCKGFVQAAGCLPWAFGFCSPEPLCSALPLADNKSVQRSLQYFTGLSNEYQLEESITKPHPADQRASEGEKEKCRIKPERVKN